MASAHPSDSVRTDSGPAAATESANPTVAVDISAALSEASAVANPAPDPARQSVASTSGQPPPPSVSPARVSRGGRHRPDLPPSYQDATDPHAPPPTYESIYGRVQEARRTATGPWHFCQRVIAILLGTVLGTLCCALFLAVTLVIPLGMLVIGSVHVHNCPAQPLLPVWLIVGSVVYVIRSSHHSCNRACAHAAGEEVSQMSAVSGSVSTVLQVVWYILGCVWLYGMNYPSFDRPSAADYCDYTLFTTCYWVITILHLFLICVLMCGCCALSAMHGLPRSCTHPSSAVPQPSSPPPASGA